MAKKSKAAVTFIDMSKETKKTLAGLSKTALRESGKVVRKLLRERIPVRSKRFKNHIGSWAFISNATGQPQLWVGFYSWQRVKKKGKDPSHANPHWIEFGTKSHAIPGAKNKGHFMAYQDNVYGFHVKHPGQRATHVLRDTVQNNIDQIRAAQEQYLKELNNTLEEAGAKIIESEEDEDD